MSTGCSPPGFRGGTASLPPVAFWWRESGLGLECGERAPLGVAVAKSPTSVCKMGVVGKGGTCCFMCVVGVAVLWGLRLSGCGWCDNLILARACTFLMVRDSEVASSKEIANALCENALCGWCLGTGLN